MATILRQRCRLAPITSGDVAFLTYYWDSTGASTTALATEAMARVRAFWNSFAARVASGASLAFDPIFDEVEETSGAIVGQAVGTLPSVVTFTGATELLPLQTQGLVLFDSGTYINGRRLKGRQFIPGAVEGDNASGGGPGVSYLAALATALPLLGTTVVTPMNQRVWHRPVNAAGGLSAIVTARSASPRWAVLRSRRGY